MKKNLLLFVALCIGAVGLVSCEKELAKTPDIIEFAVAKEQLLKDYPDYNTQNAKWLVENEYQVAEFSAVAKSSAPIISVWYKVSGDNAQRVLDVVTSGNIIPAVIEPVFNDMPHSQSTVWRVEDVELASRYNNGSVVGIYEVELCNITNDKLEAELYFDAVTGKLLLAKEELDADKGDRYVVDSALESAVKDVYSAAVIIGAEKKGDNIEVCAVVNDGVSALDVKMLFTLKKVYISSAYSVEYSNLPNIFSSVNRWFEADSSYPVPEANDEFKVVTGVDMVVNTVKCSSYITVEYNSSTDSNKSVKLAFYLDADNNIIKHESNFVSGKYAYGTFILNEGNMSSSTGTLIFIGDDGVVVNNAYSTENPGKSLPWLAQDMFRDDNKLYIIGQGGVLAVVDALTLKLIKEYELSSVGIPSGNYTTHLSVVDNCVFIRHGDNSGRSTSISKLDLSSETSTVVANTDGASKNRMVVINDVLYASAGSKILIINNGASAAEVVDVPGNRQSITLRASSDGNLWLTGQYVEYDSNWNSIVDNAIMKMNVTTKIIEVNKVNYNLGSTISSVSPILSAIGETLYFYDNNRGTKTNDIIKHQFTDKNPLTNTTIIFKDINQCTPDYKYGVVYNEISINPATNKLYVNMLKGFGANYTTNDIIIFDVGLDKLTFDKSYSNMLRFPSVIQFTPSY